MQESFGNDARPGRTVRCYAVVTDAIRSQPGWYSWEGNRCGFGIGVRLTASLRIPHGLALAPDAQSFYDPHILAGVLPAQIAQEATAPTDHLEKAPTGGKVLPVGL